MEFCPKERKKAVLAALGGKKGLNDSSCDVFAFAGGMAAVCASGHSKSVFMYFFKKNEVAVEREIFYHEPLFAEIERAHEKIGPFYVYPEEFPGPFITRGKIPGKEFLEFQAFEEAKTEAIKDQKKTLRELELDAEENGDSNGYLGQEIGLARENLQELRYLSPGDV